MIATRIGRKDALTWDRIDRLPVARRRFLQGSAVAAAAAALPLPKARAATGGCDPFTTQKVFMGTTPSPSSVLGIRVGVDREVTSAEAITYVKAVARRGGALVRRPLTLVALGVAVTLLGALSVTPNAVAAASPAALPPVHVHECSARIVCGSIVVTVPWSP